MKRINRALEVVLLTILMAVSFMGCGIKQNTVATIDGQKVSEPLYRICLFFTQKGLENLLPNMWSMDAIEGLPPEEFVKDRTLSSITYYVAARQKAVEMKLDLTQEEQKEIKDKAKEAFSKNKELAGKYKIKQKYFIDYYTYGTQIEKVLIALADSYAPNDQEISEQIAKLRNRSEGKATMTHILIANHDDNGNLLPNQEELKEKAQQILNKALNGEDMHLLAKEYSQDSSVTDNNGTYSFIKGELDESLEKVIYEKAKEGEIYPEVIETQFGYEIVRLDSLEKMTDEQLKKEAVSIIKNNFAENELKTLSTQMKIEKSDEYNEIVIEKPNTN